ncbi:MAG: hypothetical protein ACTSWX_08350 [Promethearchaeota archaeon]
MIEINKKAKNKKCFICGRTEKDLSVQFDIKSIQEEIKSHISEKNKKYNKIFGEFKKYIKNLSEDTKNYPESLSLYQINHSEEKLIQTIPRIDELCDFAPKENGRENEWVTIKELRENLKIFVDDVENNKIPERIKEFLPVWAEKILENLPVETESHFKFPILKLKNQSIVKFSDINGNPVYTDYKGEEIQYYSALNKNQINGNHVIMIILEYYICGVCEEILKTEKGNLPNEESDYWE